MLLAATDYYPFGLAMEKRDVSVSSYRYGFNGKEKDAGGEWGDLAHYDYGFRIYNPAVGRFLSVDPLAPDYPWYTPYQFAGNTPIWALDLDGLEPVKSPSTWEKIWNAFIGNWHVTRAKKFAAQNKIDQKYLFIVYGSRIRSNGPRVRNDINSSVIVYHPVESEDGVKVYKHVFKQNNSDAGTVLTSSKHDEMYQEWNLSFDLTDVPIPNEEDRSDILLDAPFGPGGGKGAVGAVRIAGSSNKVKTLYPILKGALHHIATNKNFVAGKMWSKKFEPLFKKAGYSLDDAVNKVYVPGHKGPHPEEYHQLVFDRIISATRGLDGEAYKKALDQTLEAVSKEAQTAGSYINKLLTKSN